MAQPSWYKIPVNNRTLAILSVLAETIVILINDFRHLRSRIDIIFNFNDHVGTLRKEPPHRTTQIQIWYWQARSVTGHKDLRNITSSRAPGNYREKGIPPPGVS